MNDRFGLNKHQSKRNQRNQHSRRNQRRERERLEDKDKAKTKVKDAREKKEQPRKRRRGEPDAPFTRHDLVPNKQELRNDTEDVEVHAKGEEEVPELEDLVERRRACAKGHHRWVA